MPPGPRPTLVALTAMTTLLFTAACDDLCLWGGGDRDLIAPLDLRDPATGLCVSFGTSSYPGDSCGQSRGPTPDPAEPPPDWAPCDGSCETLDEATCLVTGGCRAAYAGGAFHECWAVAPSGPVQGGDCASFDADECSRHDDCVAIHATGSPIGPFLSCAAEPADGCGDQDCDNACDSLGEAECIERGDCSALYAGHDCSCDLLGECTCAEWIFTACEG